MPRSGVTIILDRRLECVSFRSPKHVQEECVVRVSDSNDIAWLGCWPLNQMTKPTRIAAIHFADLVRHSDEVS